MAYGGTGKGTYGGNGDTAAKHVGELSGDLFAGHTPAGVFSSLKGSALGRWEFEIDENPQNIGEPRFNGEVNNQNWEATLVEGGEYDPQKVVRGTDKHMPR